MGQRGSKSRAINKGSVVGVVDEKGDYWTDEDKSWDYSDVVIEESYIPACTGGDPMSGLPLPQDVLRLLFAMIPSRRLRLALRLVCKQFRDVVDALTPLEGGGGAVDFTQMPTYAAGLRCIKLVAKDAPWGLSSLVIDSYMFILPSAIHGLIPFLKKHAPTLKRFESRLNKSWRFNDFDDLLNRDSRQGIVKAIRSLAKLEWPKMETLVLQGYGPLCRPCNWAGLFRTAKLKSLTLSGSSHGKSAWNLDQKHLESQTSLQQLYISWTGTELSSEDSFWNWLKRDLTCLVELSLCASVYPVDATRIFAEALLCALEEPLGCAQTLSFLHINISLPRKPKGALHQYPCLTRLSFLGTGVWDSYPAGLSVDLIESLPKFPTSVQLDVVTAGAGAAKDPRIDRLLLRLSDNGSIVYRPAHGDVSPSLPVRIQVQARVLEPPLWQFLTSLNIKPFTGLCLDDVTALLKRCPLVDSVYLSFDTRASESSVLIVSDAGIAAVALACGPRLREFAITGAEHGIEGVTDHGIMALVKNCCNIEVLTLHECNALTATSLRLLHRRYLRSLRSLDVAPFCWAEPRAEAYRLSTRWMRDSVAGGMAGDTFVFEDAYHD